MCSASFRRFLIRFVGVRIRSLIFLFAALASGGTLLVAQQSNPSAQKAPSSESQETVKAGQSTFMQNCAFCHGRDAGGGETGPSLTGSKLVASDVGGNKIGEVVRNGRPDKGMPRFNFSEQELSAVVAFIHYQRSQYEAHPGGRRGVSVEDLQTGNVDLGKQYFSGAGGCAGCHSASGDLAKVARKYQGLALERRMLYPEHAKAKVTVTLQSGKTAEGTLEYRDEFVIGLRDADGWYHSWPVTEVTYKVDEPAAAHAELLAKYTDADIHNLMAFLQTLK